ncbi:ArsR/SmtB family transcription factor [Shewanella mangrovi]|uniref:ArsR/SmtB family transcription factor n=1 Tax=Shewanella mangrovi TaxID=1515746 RepID=UPI000A5310A3|nr:metalloregulator ArsR/SmtB family transcription factor [Shewanella mangrovi]
MFNQSSYQDAAEFIKAMSHESRLQLIDLLTNQERCVEDLTNALNIGLKSVSAHLRVMRTQGLVTTRREGKRIFYRLSNNEVLKLAQNIMDVSRIEREISPLTDASVCITLKGLLEALENDNTLLIDVRAEDEYRLAHIPAAISIPVSALYSWSETFSEKNRQIIVYCEGHYCIEAIDAMKLLVRKKYGVKMYRNGLNEWAGAGFPLARS